MRSTTFLLVMLLTSLSPWQAHTPRVWYERPVGEVVEKLEAALEQSPEDANLHGRLGRAHMLALQTRSASIGVFHAGDVPEPVRGKAAHRLVNRDHEQTVSRDELIDHLNKAVEHLNAAHNIDPLEPHHVLTLAQTLDAGLDLIDGLTVTPMRGKPIDGSVHDHGPEWRTPARRLLLGARASREGFDNLIDVLSTPAYDSGYRDTVMHYIDEVQHRRDFRHVVPGARKADAITQREVLYYKAFMLELASGLYVSRPIEGTGHPEDNAAYVACVGLLRCIDERGERAADDFTIAIAETLINEVNSRLGVDLPEQSDPERPTSEPAPEAEEHDAEADRDDDEE